MRSCLEIFEIVACIIGFFYWRKIKKTYWKWFSIYLLCIVITENVAMYVDEVWGRRDINILIFQFFGIPIQFFFFFWLFYKYFKENQYSRETKWPFIGGCIYVAAWFIEVLFFRTKEGWFFSFSYTVGNVILSVLVLAFFIRFINSDKILGYKSDMMFWVCLGVLIYYLGSLPFYGMYNTMSNFPEFANIYWFFQMGFNCLMYFFFAISFVCGKPKQ